MTAHTLLLVSHDRSIITSACSRGIFLNKGQMLMDGLPSDVFDYYHALIAKGNERIQQNRLASGRAQVVSGTGEARVESVLVLLNQNNRELDTLEVGMPVVLEFQVCTYQPIPRLVLAFEIRDRLGQIIFNTNTNCFGKSPENILAGTSHVFRFYLLANMGPGKLFNSLFPYRHKRSILQQLRIS